MPFLLHVSLLDFHGERQQAWLGIAQLRPQLLPQPGAPVPDAWCLPSRLLLPLALQDRLKRLPPEQRARELERKQKLQASPAVPTAGSQGVLSAQQGPPWLAAVAWYHCDAL